VKVAWCSDQQSDYLEEPFIWKVKVSQLSNVIPQLSTKIRKVH
jgi:hypothetical protein